MKLRWVLLLVLTGWIAGCATAPRGMTGPLSEVASEPVMEAEVVSAAPERVSNPVMRPRARPGWVEQCRSGDDGIGGTGCPVD